MKFDLEKIRAYGNLELLARQLVDGFITGLHKSPYHGFSVEFAEHRLYNNGESTRHIDWKVYAKTDRLYTKRYEEETNLRCMVLVDSSASMFYPKGQNDKLLFSIMAASSLAYLLQRQRDAVGLAIFSEQVETFLQPKSTARHNQLIFSSLSELVDKKHPEQSSTNVAQTIHEIADRIHRRSLIILFSDMFDGAESMDSVFSSLLHLKHNQHEVLLFHVLDHQAELLFDFPDRPTVFIDVETGQREKLSPAKIRKEYNEQVQANLHKLKLKCGQYKIDFIEVDTRKEIDQILLPYLKKRARMR